METRRGISGAILPIMVILFMVSFSGAVHGKTMAASMVKPDVGNFPVHFLPLPTEYGQGEADFVAEGLAYSALLSAREVKLGLKVRDGAGEGRIGRRQVTMQFLDTGGRTRLTGHDDGGAVAHFLTGDPQDWVRNVPLYQKVQYHDVWPGIDAVFYGRMSNLEFDFMLRPGADLSRVRLRFQGVDGLRIDTRGQLVLQIGSRELPVSLPLTYQQNADGRAETLGCRFVKQGPDTVGFEVQKHNPALALVIDPIFHFSTYLGGGENWYIGAPGNTDDFGAAVDIDNEGNVYVTGHMESSEFIQNRTLDYPGAREGERAMFICKFDPDGNLIYSTRVHANAGRGIKVDALGQVYVVGDASTEKFPVVNGFQTFPGTSCSPVRHGFLLKINAEGTNILYSTFIGGDRGHDYAYDVAIDPDGSAYVVGSTRSSDFVSRHPLMENLTRPMVDGVVYNVEDVFVVKVDTNAVGDAGLLFATTLGGTLADFGYGIDIDGDRNIYIAGKTGSTDFRPLVGPLQDTFNGCHAGFLAKISAACDQVLYSTFLSEESTANDVAVEDNGHAYVVGGTMDSEILPGRNGFKEFPLTVDPFLFRINTHLTGADSLVYGTYLGGSNCDEANGVVTNGSGRVYVTGWTNSEDLPGAPASEPINGRADAFYTHIDTNQVGDASLIGAAYVGGSLNEWGEDVAMGPVGEIAMTGNTISVDFPTVAAYQDHHADGDEISRDAFLSKIRDFHYWSLPVTDIPDGGGTFWFAGTTAIRVSGEAPYCRPLAYGRISGTGLSLSVGLPEFEKDVDIYLTLQHKDYPKLLYFVDGKGRLVKAPKSPIPWKKSINGSLQSVKSKRLTFSDLPAGDWNIAMTVTPEGGSYEKAPYRWETETGVEIVPTNPKLLNLPVSKSAEGGEADADSATEGSGSNASSGGCFLSSLF